MASAALANAAPWRIILRDLHHNIVTHRGKRYLVAGQHQFKTIWFRDVCFALLVLMECPHEVWRAEFADVIRNTVDLYIEFFDPALGYGPKCVDTRSPEWRCVYESVQHAIMYRMFNIQRSEQEMDPDAPFSGLYKDGRLSVAIDSNVLVYLVAMRFGLPLTPELRVLLEWYETPEVMDGTSGLVKQGAHSDWQDSVDRGPSTFHVNLLYWMALRDTPGGVFHARAARLKRCMLRTFRGDTEGGGIVYALPHPEPFVCLDDQLLAVHWGFLPARHFVEHVRSHALWTRDALPGSPTAPSYEDAPDSRRHPHWQVKLAGLAHYHDTIHWSWVMALCGIVAFECGDAAEGERIFQALWGVFRREGGVSEIYDLTPGDGLPKQLERPTYLAEKPWTWGAAFFLRLAVQRASAAQVSSNEQRPQV